MKSEASIYNDFKSRTLSVINSKLRDLEDDYAYIRDPVTLGEFERCYAGLAEIKTALTNLDINVNLRSIVDLIQQEYQDAIKNFKLQRTTVDNEFTNRVSSEIESLKLEAKQNNTKVLEEFEKKNQVYLDLESKRLELAKYSDKILDLCSAVGITTADVTIGNDSFTKEELGGMYDEFLSYMEKKQVVNAVAYLREKVPDKTIQGVLLVIGFVIVFTPVFDVLALIALVMLFKTQFDIRSDIKTYSVLLGLLYNIHPLEMGFADDIPEDSLCKEEIEVTDARLEPIAEAWSQALNTIEDPNDLLQSELNQFTANYSAYQSEIDNLLDGIKAQRDRLMKDIIEREGRLQQLFDKLKSETHYLGDYVNNSAVMDTSFALGLENGVIEERVDIGMRNVLIRTSENRKALKAFLQVMVANALCSVKANYLTVYVYDPNNFGMDISPFYRDELLNVLVFKNDNLDEVLKELKAYALNNVKDMRGASINDFNRHCEEVGKTPKEYKLLLVLSQPKKFEEDEALTTFMEYSSKLGVLVWVVSDKNIKDTKVFNRPFEGVKYPYIVDSNTFCSRVAATVVDAIKRQESEALMWDEFTQIVIPDDGIWSRNTDSAIALDPGFHNGDPTDYEGYTVGNEGDIHAIIAGNSGAGKSVFINHLICNLTRMYSPRDIELWLIDFKGAEFAMYLGSEKCPAVLPHIKACLCTSDGDFAGSLFTAVVGMAKQRYELLIKEGFKNIKDYNKSLRKQGKDHEIIPRAIVIVDEFQVIFAEAEPVVIERLKSDITYLSKVARAAGVHLMFASQSMKGTVSEDILAQFTLRFILRCDESISTQLLGNKNASNIKQKNGYLYGRCLQDKSSEEQKRYRTPFIPDDRLFAHIKQMAQLAIENKMPKKNVITYQEKDVHQLSEVDVFYEENSQKVPDQGLILLGRRMAYSENRAPDNIVMTAENNTHIFSAFRELDEVVKFYRTLLANFSNHRISPQVIVNSQLEQLNYLCDLESTVIPELREIATPATKMQDIISMAEGIFAMRQESNYKDVPVYFILFGWNKAVGFGVEKDVMLTNRVVKLLETCGTLNMHFIFICTATNAIPGSIISACKYLICGKVDAATSISLFNSKFASKELEKLSKGYLSISKEGAISRAKLYQSVVEREIEKKELIL